MMTEPWECFAIKGGVDGGSAAEAKVELLAPRPRDNSQVAVCGGGWRRMNDIYPRTRHHLIADAINPTYTSSSFSRLPLILFRHLPPPHPCDNSTTPSGHHLLSAILPSRPKRSNVAISTGRDLGSVFLTQGLAIVSYRRLDALVYPSGDLHETQHRRFAVLPPRRRCPLYLEPIPLYLRRTTSRLSTLLQLQP